MNSLIKFLYLIIIVIFLTLPSISCISPTRGDYYFKKQNFEQAITEYNYVLEQDPNNYRANLNMGEIYFERREFEKALSFYKKAAEKKPDDKVIREKIAKVNKIFLKVEAVTQEGDIFFNDKNYTEADVKYKEALDMFPGYQIASDKSEECHNIINNAAIDFSEGATAERDENFKRAFEKYRDAYELTPYNDNYKKKMDIAKAEYKKNRALIEQGIASINQGNFDEAITTLEKRALKARKSDEINLHVAIAYSKLVDKHNNGNDKLRDANSALKKLELIQPDSEQFIKTSNLKDKLLNDIESVENKVALKMKKAHKIFQRKNYDQAMKTYRSIVEVYNQSKYVKVCKKSEILCMIEMIFLKKYNPLPQLEPANVSKVFENVVIEISNETSYKLQFYFHGIDAGSVDVKSGSTEEIDFKPGTYKLAAKLFAGKYFYFAQKLELSQGKYSLLFYEKR